MNPLTAIDGVRNPNDSLGRASHIREDNRQSLSAAVNLNDEAKEQNQPPSAVRHQTWVASRNAKPPLFRHQMMLRTSEPDYSASQDNSLSPPNGAALQGGAAELRNTSNQHSFNRGSLPLAPCHDENHHRQEGSERKNNPLAYLLASANASVDTTTQANIHPNRQNDNLMV